MALAVGVGLEVFHKLTEEEVTRIVGFQQNYLVRPSTR